MPVQENVMGLGSWSMRLKADTPKPIRDAVSVPFTTLLITPTHLLPDLVEDATILQAARYAGVVLRPGPGSNLSGVGLGWWLGDGEGQGSVIAGTLRYTNESFSTVVSGLIGITTTRPLTAGSIQNFVPTYNGVQQWVSRREALESVARAYGAEYRINPNLTVDVGTPSYLYGSIPGALLVRHGSGDLVLRTVDADLQIDVDFEQVASTVYVFGKAAVGSFTAEFDTARGWRNPRGANVDRSVVFEAGMNVAPGTETAQASVLRSALDNPLGRLAVTVSTQDYDVRGTLRLGENVYVYDLDLGLRDPNQQMIYDGVVIHPTILRILAMRWAIEAGMGVYIRHVAAVGAAPTYVDLTDYVEPEAAGAEIEVGASTRLAEATLSGSPGARTDVVSRTQDRLEASAWEQYTPIWAASTAPSVGAGTLTGFYRRAGTVGFLRVHIQLGTGLSVGSGTYTVSLPTGWNAAAGGEQWIPLKLYYADYGALLGMAWVSGTVMTLWAQPPGSALTQIGSSTPRTLVSGSNIHIEGALELAS